MSLHFIHRASVDKLSRILDVGGGASMLVDHLLAEGFQHISVLDISRAALHEARERLGPQAENVTWIEADVTQAALPCASFDLWHDRAVFHFLTNAESRRRYTDVLRHALRPDGHLIMATFALDGPARCSNLDVVRYSPEALLSELGPGFELVDSARETHVTPFGGEQRFIFCWFRRR
ncbi:MAG: class I SAM-dependent methyltransferase [Anaerolineae bacterium]